MGGVKKKARKKVTHINENTAHESDDDFQAPLPMNKKRKRGVISSSSTLSHTGGSSSSSNVSHTDGTSLSAYVPHTGGSSSSAGQSLSLSTLSDKPGKGYSKDQDNKFCMSCGGDDHCRTSSKKCPYH
ncbi:hypothetical protein K501DRAFT_305416 [Backusella circina FSU 941]|nr:hypothetical protein K501DRAFT_305416 [Backusella circina FSU 941]